MARRNHPRSYPQRSKAGRRPYEQHPEPIKVTVCPTGKRGFSHVVAEMKLAIYASTTSARHATPQRTYRCTVCDSWHLTSQYKRGET